MVIRSEEKTSDADLLCIGDRKFASRLMVGTGKYKDFDETKKAIEASGAEIVTVAVRRVCLLYTSPSPRD